MIVVDASVAAKWTIHESGSEESLALLDASEELIAPDLLLPEVANVLRKKCRRGEADTHQCERAIRGLQEVISRFVPSIELVEDAFALSEALDHSVYDCFYLVCALPGARLVSADERFVTKCHANGLGSFVALQAEFALLSKKAPVPDALNSKVETIDRLSKRMEQTFDALAASANRPEAGRFQFMSSEVFAPAFDSPAYRRLAEEMNKLTDDDLATVVALGWLGRSYYSIEEWASFLENARGMVASGRTRHMTYFIAQMPNVATGLAKLRAAHQQ